MTFDEKLKRLEEIANKMEGSKPPLEEMINLFKEGMKLSAQCKVELSAMDKEIQKVISETENGDLKTEKLED